MGTAAALGIYRLADCGTDVLHDFGERCRDSGIGRQRVYKILGALTRLWAFDQLSAHPNGIGRPPWEDAGIDDYLPAATTFGGENETEPLAAETMGPLLVWAMRVVCHYKRATALCHRDGVKDAPSLDHCVPGCGNVIRTDQHAIQLREHATVMDIRAARVPGPLGDRLRANADKLRGYADTHDRTRITLTEAAR